MNSMGFVSLAKVVADEESAYRYLLKAMDLHCPSCGCRHAYTMSRKRCRQVQA